MSKLEDIVTPEMRRLATEIDYRFERRAPGVFLPYQSKWAADKSAVKVVEKSRRIGLTWGESADDVTCAASKGGMDVWYIGYNKDMAIEFILDCAQWAAHLNAFAAAIEPGEEVFMDGDERKSVLTYSIKFASGNRITALSSRPANLRGKQGRVILDEAAFHEQLGELLKAAMALLIWGGQVRVISTHNGDSNPFNELINDIRAGKLPYSIHRITFDQALADGLYDRVCQRLGKKWSEEGQAEWRKEIRASYGSDAEEELDCVPKNSAGAWLSRNLIEARMVDAPVLRWEAPKGFELWPEEQRRDEGAEWIAKHLTPELKRLDARLLSGFGEDFGRTGDLTVFAPWQITRLMKRNFPFLIELRNMPFQQQEQVLVALGNGLPRFISAALDARGNGQYLAERAMQIFGGSIEEPDKGRVEMVMLSEGWYREHTAPMKAAFEDDSIILPRDSLVMEDLRAFQVVRGIPRIPDVRKEDGKGNKRHGDAGVAILLGYYASRRDVGEIEFEAVGRPRESSAAQDYAEPERGRLSDFMGAL